MVKFFQTGFTGFTRFLGSGAMPQFLILLIVLILSKNTIAKTFDVDISTGRPAASNEAFYHGETIEFRAVRGRSVVTNIEYSCIWYTTNNSSSVASGEGGWWKTDGLVFHPTNDCGAAAYRFFLEGRDEIGRDWHANGTLRMLPSPGFSPNAIELPAKVLDFAEVEVENAPWPAEIEAAIAEIPTPDLSDYATHEDVETAANDATNYVDEVARNTLESANEFTSLTIPMVLSESLPDLVPPILGNVLPNLVPPIVSNTVTRAYVEDLGIKPADPAYSWVRPDAWAIDVAIDKAEVAGTATVDESGTDAAGRIFTNVTYSTTYQMAAQCLPRMLDESSTYFPIITSWAALPPGGTIDENGHFTAATSGLYRVSATASDGVTKYADVAISAERTVVTSNEYAYVDDDAAFLRHGCHTNALALLDAADTATTNYYGTTEYVVWNAYKPRFISTISGAGGTDRGPGDDRCFAVSAHILASASHHWPKKYNAQEFSDGANTYTVTKQVWVDLPTWAVSHGFTAAEAAAVNDLSLILCTGDAIPDSCRPYFLTPEAFARRFGSDAGMLTGWRITQLSDWAMPIVFKYANFTTWYAWGDTRRDLRKLITDMRFDTYPAHGGDSGLPIFLLDGTREIVVAHHTSVAGCRADYIAGFRIIKAFVEAHGETLKEVE